MHKLLTPIYIFSLMVLCLGQLCGGSVQKPAQSSAKSIDVVLGNGPLTVIEYGSLSCGGCAHFAKEILPAIENDYVKTGKIRLLFRPMVMNPNDVNASMLVCCAPNPHKLQLAYWKQQHEWVGASDDQPVRKIAQSQGMTVNQIGDCLADAQLRQNLLTKKFVALKAYNIKSIPTIFINDREYPDIKNAEDLSKAIEQELKQAHNKPGK